MITDMVKICRKTIEEFYIEAPLIAEEEKRLSDVVDGMTPYFKSVKYSTEQVEPMYGGDLANALRGKNDNDD